MTSSPQDSTAAIAFPLAVMPALPLAPAETEQELLSLFSQFRKPVLRYVSGMGVSLQDAEEIVQEVFLALFRHLRWGRSRRNLRGWIFRVAHNLALKQRFADQKTRVCMARGDFSLDARMNPDPDPEQRLVALQRRGSLLAVVRALPEKDQCCLRLRAEGLRYREIAQVLNISLGAVSISLTRSLDRLLSADRP